MAQMPWGWGNLPAERGKGAGRPERCQARMTLPGSQTPPSTNQGMQGGVEPLRGIHREIPQEGTRLAPLCWPSGLEDGLAQKACVCVSCSLPSPLFCFPSGLFLLPEPSFPWTPSPSLGRWSGVGPEVGRQAVVAGLAGRGPVWVVEEEPTQPPLWRHGSLAFPLEMDALLLFLLLPCFLHGPNVPESAASGRHYLSLSLDQPVLPLGFSCEP